jgi:pimeloyl-ACP methyl ester carboxylesterase
MTMRGVISFVDVPGVRLRVLDTGGDGVALVLLHANTGTIEAWEPQVGPFADAGYRVIAFDRRGWGESIARPDTGQQPGTLADDLDALADRLKLDRFHLLGVAGGGFSALDYAAWRGERLRSLVAAATSAQLAEKEIDAIRLRIEFEGFRKLPPHHREIGPSYRGGDPDGVERWIEIDHRSRQTGAPLQPLRTPNTYAKLATIATPTLVIAGCADAVSPPSMMRLWAGKIPDSQFALVPEAGHAVSWEQPSVFNALVLNFMARH